MSRRQKTPLRPVTPDERAWLERITRAGSEPVDHVIRAKVLLAVAAGQSYTAAARLAGRQCGDSVSQVVERFNRLGLQALETQPGRGTKPTYGAAERARILAEVRRPPDPARDGTATWSLMTLRRALRRAPDGLPRVSTYTIRQVLQDAGMRYLATRTWCATGQAVRRRKGGSVTVSDPEAEAKKN